MWLLLACVVQLADVAIVVVRHELGRQLEKAAHQRTSRTLLRIDDHEVRLLVAALLFAVVLAGCAVHGCAYWVLHAAAASVLGIASSLLRASFRVNSSAVVLCDLAGVAAAAPAVNVCADAAAADDPVRGLRAALHVSCPGCCERQLVGELHWIMVFCVVRVLQLERLPGPHTRALPGH